MKLELHLHTNLYSPCATASPQEQMARLIETGYQAVYITEHDAVWSDDELDDLRRQFPAIRIFSGVEVTLRQPTGPAGEYNQHLVVLGTDDVEYVNLAGNPAAVLAKARDEGCLTVLAHPYRWEGSCTILAAGLLPDAIECHTGNQNDAQAFIAEALSRQIDIPLVNAGDSHATSMIDRFWIETDQPVDQARDIRKIVLEGKYRNCIKE